MIHPSSPITAHPLANLFPMCSSDVLNLMEQDMRKSGFDAGQPIVMLDGQVLDGRNRFYAAIQAGVEPVFREHSQALDGDPRMFVFRRNLPRRDLTPSDRVKLVLEFRDLIGDVPHERGERQREALAKVAGTSDRLMQDGLTVQKEAPDLWDKVSASELSVSDAAKQLKERRKEAAAVSEWEQSADARAIQVADLREKGADALADAVEKGSVLRNIEELATVAMLPHTELERLGPLLVSGKSLKDAQAFLDAPLTATTTLADLLARGQMLAKDYSGRILAHGDKHLIHEETIKGATVYVVFKKPKS